MRHDTAAPERKQLTEQQLETIQQALSEAETMDSFFGKEGIFARLFADTVEAMLEAEMTEHLGYERYESKGHKSGNSRNGSFPAPLRASTAGRCDHPETARSPRDIPIPLCEKARTQYRRDRRESAGAVWQRVVDSGHPGFVGRNLCSRRRVGHDHQHDHRQGVAPGGSLAKSALGRPVPGCIFGCDVHQNETQTTGGEASRSTPSWAWTWRVTRMCSVIGWERAMVKAPTSG